MSGTWIKYQRLRGGRDRDEMESITLPPSHISRPLILALVASLIANLAFLVHISTKTCSLNTAVSSYAGIRYKMMKPYIHDTEWSSGNKSRMQELWDNFSWDAGLLYITPEVADKMHLPDSERFPWNQELKLYVLNAAHNLHCLKLIQKTLSELEEGQKNTTYPIGHVYHCLDAFRADVMCHADDTPRYTGLSQGGFRYSGSGQMRLCRDWDELTAWAQQYSGCYRQLLDKHNEEDEVYRFVHCAPNSPYYKVAQEYAREHNISLDSRAG